jgi:hypothetical protein
MKAFIPSLCPPRRPVSGLHVPHRARSSHGSTAPARCWLAEEGAELPGHHRLHRPEARNDRPWPTTDLTDDQKKEMQRMADQKHNAAVK